MSRRSSVGEKADLTPQLRKMNRISPSRGNASSGLYVLTIGFVDEHPDVPTMWRSRVSRQAATLKLVAFVITTEATPRVAYKRIMLRKPPPPPSLKKKGTPSLSLTCHPNVIGMSLPVFVRCGA